MPNWIVNRVVVKGNSARLRALLDAIKSNRQPFDFDRVIPVPDLIKHASSGYMSMDGREVEHWYTTDDGHHRLFTPEEEKELKELGYRSARDWALANWGADRNACEIELDESTADLGYLIIKFESACGPPRPVLQRLQKMFPDIGFACRWFHEDEFIYRYHPDMSLPIARCQRKDGPGQQITSTLYMTNDKYGEFFLETQTTTETVTGEPRVETEIARLSEAEVNRWLLSSDVKLLALLYPLPEPQTDRAHLSNLALTQILGTLTVACSRLSDSP